MNNKKLIGQIRGFFKKAPLYIFLFSIYPAVALYSVNIGDTTLNSVTRPLFFSVALTLGVYFFVFLIIRKTDLAGVITLILLLAFFSYGHVFTLSDNFRPFGVRLSRNSYLIGVYILLLFISVNWVLRKQKQINRAIPYLNIITLAILIFPTLQLIKYSIDSSFENYRHTQSSMNNELILNSSNKPDVYLIVLDGYNREDILKNDFNYDNSEFLNDLRTMGFTVADCSMGNYTQTRLAMASELNLDYMDRYFPGQELVSKNPTTNKLFSNNEVRRLLENSGYQTYTFENREWPFITWENVDHLLISSQENIWGSNVTDFEKLFLDSTLISIVSQYYPDWVETKINPTISKITSNSAADSTPYLFSLTKYMLETLPILAEQPSPKFVYAHIVATHPPFFFNPDGSLSYPTNRINYDDESFKRGYNRQLDFINPRLISVVESILEKSSKPPIIIIQSDHGYNQFPGQPVFRPNQNFLAINLPGDHNGPYKSISSVNIFRYIFNEYFGMDYPFLEDISYRVDGKNYSLTRIYDLEEGCK